MPLMFLAGWWVAGWSNGQAGVTAALLVWLMYAVVDVAIISAAEGWTQRIVWLASASLVTKLVAAYAGARIRIG